MCYLYKKILPDKRGDVLSVPEISDRQEDVKCKQEIFAWQESGVCTIFTKYLI